MRQSQLFTKTRREEPAEEESKNAKLLIRGGFIHKEMAGVYSFLPLGLKVLNKVVSVIRREMDAIGGQEVFLSAFQDKLVWEKTGRWQDDAVPIWFKTKLQSGGELGLSFTHEEPLTNLMRDFVRSFRDLPAYVYQFQTKFRNEVRARSGIIRGREFLMKDLYSFSRNEKEHAAFYDSAKNAYRKIFNTVGLRDKTYLTFASGGSFSKYSHEFQTVTETGEDTIHLCEKCEVAVNDEIFAEQKSCPECGGKNFVVKKSVEVGNIFNLGTRFSEAFNLSYLDESGNKKLVVMGSYGIGPGRLMGTVVEVLSDEKGIVWPPNIAPFGIHLLSLAKSNEKNNEVVKAAEQLYERLQAAGAEVLFDDRSVTAGEKFADSDLIGVPIRVVVSDKTQSAGKFEVKRRGENASQVLAEKELLKLIHV